MKKKRNRYIFLMVLGVLMILGTVAFLRSTIGKALLKSKSHFITSAIDPRVRYEPEAKEHGEKIAAFLAEAIKRVEEGHYTPFEKEISVYVCASNETMNEYNANPGAQGRGYASFKGIYIGPYAFSFQGLDTHKESLMHELSHLHLNQKLGYLGMGFRIKVPIWFREGIANSVAGSGGEGIDEGEAVNNILNGKHFP